MVSAGVEHGAADGPTDQELRLVEKRREATLLAAALVHEPFSRETADAALRYLAGADEACADFAEVRALTDDELRARIAELTAARRRKASS